VLRRTWRHADCSDHCHASIRTLTRGFPGIYAVQGLRQAGICAARASSNRTTHPHTRSPLSDMDKSPPTSAAGTLKPVRRANLPMAIADQLRRQIAAGEFTPGQQLPGHRDLASIFNVSVGTVREAISTLVSEGLIEARAGWGTFVAETRALRAGEPLAPPLERQEP